MVDNDNKEIQANLQPTTAAAQFLAGPTDSGGEVTYRAITSADLPVGTDGQPGALTPGVSLSVDSEGVVDLAVKPGGAQETEFHAVQI